MVQISVQKIATTKKQCYNLTTTKHRILTQEEHKMSKARRKAIMKEFTGLQLETNRFQNEDLEHASDEEVLDWMEDCVRAGELEEEMKQN